MCAKRFFCAGIFLLALGLLATPPPAPAEGGYVYLTQWGSFGSGNGQFAYPQGVATDAAGNVYVGDEVNHRIQKFTSAGAYLTQWGWVGIPIDVATDAAGNVYVTDYRNNCIQKFTSDGTYLTQWGSYGTGNGQFYYPSSVAIDAAGNVYVVEQENHRIQKFGPDLTAANAFSWGGVKARYRLEGTAKQTQEK